MSRITLPAVYQHHMMLQRDKLLKIRGQASSGSRITVALGDTRVSVAVTDGLFSCDFPPQSAGRNKTLSFFVDNEDTADLEIHDISIGDIWMACGQSNMEYFLRYDANWNETKKLPPNGDIHMYNVPRIAFEGQHRPQQECGYWFQEGDEAWPLFSAPGYSFARTLQPDLHIPVGIIGCNWGGTPACAWMGEEWQKKAPLDIFQREYAAEAGKYSETELKNLSMKALEFEDSYRHQLEWRAVMYGLTEAEQDLWKEEHRDDPELPLGPYHHYRPSGLYHTMIEAIAPFAIKGFLWYQGESDTGHADIYDQTMAALVDCFRTTWQDQELPFLFVQLAPFGHWLDCSNEGYAAVRAQQEKAAEAIPGTAMASIMDLGSWEDIHPKFKMEVGRRLALLAKGHVYGFSGLFDAPAFASASRNGRQITLHFHFAGDGLTTDSTPEEGFIVTQNGEKLKIDGCSVTGDTVILTLSGALPSPVHISYAEEDYCTVHIWNPAGLSARPFHCTIR